MEVTLIHLKVQKCTWQPIILDKQRFKKNRGEKKNSNRYESRI